MTRRRKSQIAAAKAARAARVLLGRVSTPSEPAERPQTAPDGLEEPIRVSEVPEPAGDVLVGAVVREPAPTAGTAWESIVLPTYTVRAAE